MAVARSTNSEPRPAPRRRRQRTQWLITSAVLALLASALWLAGRGLLVAPAGDAARSGNRPPRASSPPHGEREDSAAAADDAGAAPRFVLIEDDAQTLWASPTAGPPLDLSYLPPGAQVILAVRPAALVAHPEGAKVLAALGPAGERGSALFRQWTGMTLSQIERLTVGWQVTGDGDWQFALVATGTAPVTPDELAARLPGADRRNRGSRDFLLFDHCAYYLPADRGGRLLVVASPAVMADVIDLAGEPPPLGRDIERALAHTDADRMMTLVAAPNVLWGDGRSLFSGAAARLREPLFWFLGDGLGAILLSMHWDENFFVEFSAWPTLDVLPDRLAGDLSERVAQLPERVEQYVVGLEVDPYGRRVVARFPAMVRKLSGYTRSGFDAQRAILRCYLPAVAGHNLLMGAELTLAEPPGRSAAGDSQPAPLTVAERLRQRTSLRFARDTLEAALEMLSQDVGVPIVIIGGDLQLEGITKNQSLGIDLDDRPAEAILVEILRLANPDKTAAGPADPRQKLVYVVKRESPGGPEVVLVTTRGRAVERGDRLPEVFQSRPE